MASTAPLETLVVRIEADVAPYTRGLQQAQSQTKKAAQDIKAASGEVESFGFGMRRWALQAMGALAPLAGIVGGIGSAFRAVQLAAEMEQLEISFEVLVGDAQRAQKAIADLTRFAAETPFTLPEVMASAKQMLGFGTQAEDIIPTMYKLGDVASSLNINLGQLTYVFGTLKAQGRAFTIDINQFATRGIPIWKTLAEVMFNDANAVNKVRQAVEAGQVGFAQVDEAFRRMTTTGGQFAGMMQRQSQSVLGLYSTMTDAVNGFLRVLGAQIIESLHLKDVMRFLIVTFEGAASLLRSGLSPGITQVITLLFAITAAATAFSLIWPIVSSLAVGAISVITGALTALLTHPVFLIGAALVGIFMLWAQSVGGVANAVEIMRNAFNDFIEWITPVWIQLRSTAEAAWEGIREIVLLTVGFIQGYFQELWNTIVLVWTGLFGDTQIYWEDIKDFIINALIALEFNIHNFGAMWNLAWTGIALGAVRVFDELTMNLLPNFMAVSTGIVTALVDLFSGLWDVIRGEEALTNIPSRVGAAFEAAFNEMREAMGAGESELAAQLQEQFDQQSEELARAYEDFHLDRMAALAITPSEQQAANNAANRAGQQIGNNLSGGAKKGMQKFEAVLFGSAEALTRLAEYSTRLTLSTASRTGASSPAAAVAASTTGVVASSASVVPVASNPPALSGGANSNVAASAMVQLLGDIKDILTEIKNRPVPLGTVAEVV